MRTAISILGGGMFGVGLGRLLCFNYKEASIMLMISSITYFTGYLIELYNNDKKGKA